MVAVASALSAYPWTRFWLIRWRDVHEEPRYCAMGALLRFAGVHPDDIVLADLLGAIDFWKQWGPLLSSEYGVPGFQSAHRIVTLNDSATTQAEATGKIIKRMSTTCPMGELLTAEELQHFDSHLVEVCCDAILRHNGHPAGPYRPSLRPCRWPPRRRRPP